MTHDPASRRALLGFSFTAFVAAFCWHAFRRGGGAATTATPALLKPSDAEWNKRLSPRGVAMRLSAA